MLQKHPDQYSDEELEAWVRHLVDEQVSEGPRLDYKATIKLDRQPERIEAAKDISSFANEIGGTVIYGIPEDKQSDETAIPCKPYGIDPVPDLESRLENIYVDSISPRLLEWGIKKVDLTEYPGKVVYIVWTPGSWLGPHMVQAYGDKRYYRRGQLRAVIMEEHELRARYERTRNLESAVEEFLDSPQCNYMGSLFPNDEFISHYVICPLMLSAERVEFASTDMKGWLEANLYQNYVSWSPSRYGVRAKESEQDRWDRGLKSCSEIHRSGAINHWKKARVRQEDEIYRLIHYHELKEMETFLQFARSFYEKIQYFGPLRFRVMVDNRPSVTLWLRRHRERFPDEAFALVTHDGNLSIDFTEPSSKLFENPNLILKEIADEMFRAFGTWVEPDCFDEQLNLRTY